MHKISFSWKPTISGREKWRWGLFMTVPSRSGRSPRLRILMRGVLLWLLGLLALAYLGLTTAWYAVLNQRTTNYVTWADCVLAPVRWEEIKRKRGDAYIDEGLVALEARRWSEAVLKIRAGLAQSPDHWRGRRSLGLFHLAAGQRSMGLQVMVAGFTSRYQGRDAVELIIQAGLLGQDYDVLLDVIDTSLAHSGAAVDRDRDWLIDQKCRILLTGGRYEAALAWISKQEQMNELRHESRVVALLELKRYDEARAALGEWQKGSGVLGGVRRLTVRLERELGNHAAMRAALREMRERAPLDPQPWAYSMAQEYLADAPSEAAALLQGFFMRFGLNPAALVSVAQALKQVEAWELLDKLMVYAAETRIELPLLHRVAVEAALARGDYAAADRSLERLQPADEGTPTSTQEHWYHIMRPLVAHLISGGDASREQLLARLRSFAFALPFAEETAGALEQADRLSAAMEVWQIAKRRYPNSPKVERAMNRLASLLHQAVSPEVEIPRVQDGQPLDLEAVLLPEPTVSADITLALQSARQFALLSDRLIADERWGELDRLLREVRRQAPGWASSRQEIIRSAEMELNIGDQNWPALVSNVRLRLDGSLDRALEAMKIARRVDGRGSRSAAEQILVEIERRHQDFPPARRLREDWVEGDASLTDADEENGSLPREVQPTE